MLVIGATLCVLFGLCLELESIKRDIKRGRL